MAAKVSPIAGLLCQLQLNPPDIDDISESDRYGRFYFLSIHEGPVGAIDVAQPPTAVAPGKKGVLSRNEVIVKDYEVTQSPADGGDSLQRERGSGGQARLTRFNHDQMPLRGTFLGLCWSKDLKIARDDPNHLEQEEVKEENEDYP